MTSSLLARRPLVGESAYWLSQFLTAVRRLGPASQLLGARVCFQSWKVLSAARDADVAETVDEQNELARLVAAHRQVGIAYLCRYPKAKGVRIMAVTEKGAAALALLEGYDPLLQTSAGFDTELVLRRLYDETRFK